MYKGLLSQIFSKMQQNQSVNNLITQSVNDIILHVILSATNRLANKIEFSGLLYGDGRPPAGA